MKKRTKMLKRARRKKQGFKKLHYCFWGLSGVLFSQGLLVVLGGGVGVEAAAAVTVTVGVQSALLPPNEGILQKSSKSFAPIGVSNYW